MNLSELGIPEVGRGILWPMIRFNETYEQYRERCIDQYGMKCDSGQIKKIFYTTAYDHAMSVIHEKDIVV